VPHGRTATILGLIVVILLAGFVRFDGLDPALVSRESLRLP